MTRAAVTIAQQLLCVEREIRMRERVYPRWVEKGNLTQEKAAHEIACMRAVEETLRTMLPQGGLPL